MRLPIPKFLSVDECYLSISDIGDDEGYVRFMALDPAAGHSGRYSVIELDLNSGKAICIGRELPKKYAKKMVRLGSAQMFYMEEQKNLNG